MAQQLKAEGAASVSSSPGKGQVVRAIKVSATVSAIDKASRTITLKDAAGKKLPLVAGPEVRNFDQITVGSEVVVGMMQALALELKKGPGGAPTLIESADSARAASGAQPGAMAARKITATGDVIALDAKTQTATLKGPRQTVDLEVPRPKQFKMIAVGDQIQVTYTEAVAISVEPAKKK